MTERVTMFELPTTVFNVEAALIGQGAYGAVCRATIKKNNAVVAIKRIAAFNKNLDTAKKILREIVILRHLQTIPQVVRAHLVFRSPVEKTVYIVMDYFPSDLSAVIKQQRSLNEEMVRYMIAQLLLGIRGMHKAGTIHRDLSTRNILVNNECEIAIADFGLARFFDPEEHMSFGVVTQWYRAPEIVTDAAYNSKVDVWSVGVIMAELLLQGHLFAGKPNDLADQLNKIMRIVGLPTPEWFTDKACTLQSSSDNAKLYINRIAASPQAAAMFKPTLLAAPTDGGPNWRIPLSAGARDVLSVLLRFNPDERPSAAEALQLPWFDPLRDFIKECEARQDTEVREIEHPLLSHKAPRELTSDLGVHVDAIESLAPTWADQMEAELYESLAAEELEEAEEPASD
jgi:serine/threonine protein kinase